MTEDEAKQKWCPFANVYVAYQGTGASGNRGLSDTRTAQDWKGKALCLGSDCMAWRCGTRGAVKHRETNVVRFLMPGDTYNPLEEIHFEADDKYNGYCGLAGKP